MDAHPTIPTRTGWIFSESFLKHNAGLPHPESPARLQAILARLRDSGLLARMVALPFGAASDEEITRVHDPAYLTLLDQAEGQYLDPDTYVGEGSPWIARLAAGGTIAAARAVWNGEVTNAFCAVRPPGHHALPDRGMGFCLLNNIALAAADILAQAPGRRVLIVDWDVHHGNGTQAIFCESAAVMYASIHQYPFYPGTGGLHESGRGSGLGTTMNRPLAVGAGDKEFLAALAAILDGPALDFRPDMVLVSAGFDAHVDDPLASLCVTTDGFAQATRQVCDWARRSCGGRLLSVLEGGYDLGALADSVAAHVAVLLEHSAGMMAV